MINLADITNRWRQVQGRRIRAEHIRIHQAREGAAYLHHPHVAYQAGRLFVSWSCGIRDEDRPGQEVQYAISDDYGLSWGRQRRLPLEVLGRFGSAIMVCNGIRPIEDRLVAYIGVCDIVEDAQLSYYTSGGNATIDTVQPPYYDHVRTCMLSSFDQGETWQQETTMLLGALLNLCPSPCSDGRLLYPGNIRYYYSDDPRGLSDWIPTNSPGIPVDYIESPAGYRRLDGFANRHFIAMEASFFCIPGEAPSSIVMMHRTNLQRLAASVSLDSARTWSPLELTDYTDCGSRIHFGNLYDGRAFGLSTPQPGSVRTPLVLAISEDGLNFDKHFILGDDGHFLPRLPGVHKYGRYGYPYFCQSEEFGFVVYSVNKEDIWILRFPIEDLL